MKKIKIFLASSNELLADREAFEREIYRKSKTWIDKGVSLHLEIWEDLSAAVSQSRSQDEYNKKIKEADIFVLLAYSKVGIYTAEEFGQAYELFKKNNKLRIFTYFKNSDKEKENSLEEFKKELENLEHFYASYSDFNHLWLQFNKELDSLLLGNFEIFLPTQKENLENEIQISTENEAVEVVKQEQNKMENKDKGEKKGILKPLLVALDYLLDKLGYDKNGRIRKKLEPAILTSSIIILGIIAAILGNLASFDIYNFIKTFFAIPASLVIASWIVAAFYIKENTKKILGIVFIVSFILFILAYLAYDNREIYYKLRHEYQKKFPKETEKKEKEEDVSPVIEEIENNKEEEKISEKETKKVKKQVKLHKVYLKKNYKDAVRAEFEGEQYEVVNGYVELKNVDSTRKIIHLYDKEDKELTGLVFDKINKLE